MKRITAVLLIIILISTFFTGCGNKKDRLLYNNVNLADYVEIEGYKGIEIDTASKEYAELYTYYLYGDIYQYKIENEEIIETVSFDSSAETVVEFGDMVNIDFVGYKGETAFEGGTANGVALLIGSKSYIDDFEDQLIGTKPGQTVEVNVTFPKDYSQQDLAGAEAKFVVTINSVAKNPEQIYQLFELESQEEYVEILNDRALQSFVFDVLGEKSEVKDYPKKDVEKFYEAAVEHYPATYGVDITQQDKDAVLNELIYPTMRENIVMYYILDTENLEIYESTIESQGVENAVIAESYAVNEIVIEYLLDNATIK